MPLPIHPAEDHEAGNIKFDGINYYALDAESRVCAFHDTVFNQNWTNVYDAESHRVAKGIPPNGGSCYTGSSFSPDTTQVLGLNGEEFSQIGRVAQV